MLQVKTLALSGDERAIVDLLTTAIEGGSTYWCGRITLKGDNHLGHEKVEEILDDELVASGERLGVQLLRATGAYAVMEDAESEDTWAINKASLIYALDRLRRKYTFSELANWDAEVADVFLQFAAFDDIIFG